MPKRQTLADIQKTVQRVIDRPLAGKPTRPDVQITKAVQGGK